VRDTRAGAVAQRCTQRQTAAAQLDRHCELEIARGAKFLGVLLEEPIVAVVVAARWPNRATISSESGASTVGGLNSARVVMMVPRNPGWFVSLAD
jgi:hypothetical protein